SFPTRRSSDLLYYEGGKELGDRLFHDFAGWVMMPLALLILWAGLKVLDWVLVEDLGQASREDVIKNVAGKPAYLFMTALQGQGNGGKPANPAPGGKGPPQETTR